MIGKRRKVHLFVDEKYFKNCFEPGRMNLSKKLGTNLTVGQFTAHIHDSQLFGRKKKRFLF